MPAFRALTILAALGLVALMLYAGQPSQPWWWVYAIPFGLWIIGPAVVPYLVARRSPRLGPVLFMFLAVSSAASAYSYFQAFFRSESSTAALVMLFVPLYQWLALGLTIALAVALDRWRKKPWSG